ncbi:fructokinase [Arboricoccus pini]|uniref:Fructokinase n=1 Tax=Arboricoccus pini TaxID=1963835 RepID=A0A212QSG0_9PROT|nr:ROK family protein [Arboricoccus pini]SNB62396.1 fructokinase [Arboricoccus pini]
MTEAATVNAIAIGIDLGGTKIEARALAPDGGELLRRRLPTPSGSGDDAYQAVLAAIVTLVGDVEQELGQVGSVGICHPGTTSPVTGLMKNCNRVFMNGRPFETDLSRHMGRRMAFANDANCLALSEAIDGAGAGANSVFAVIIGTGCGGGIAVHGKVLAGPNRVAGEWGHNPLPWPDADELPGRQCFCGQRGCLEEWISGPAFARDHREATGVALDAPSIVAAALAGDAPAMASLDRYVDRLGRALATLVNTVDPDVIVLGGGMSNVSCLYERLPPVIAGRIFSDTFTTPIRPASHGDSSGVRGAAWLGRDLQSRA